ncbi:hypothetical protein [Shouchella miscanthi]|uniref:hypothetical protein n=1 Tax=Shouchella miscanthi TaxID=2598861 RepID=UPI0011A405CF|nr:hypothetical protein [Shouchella miscanthi]
MNYLDLDKKFKSSNLSRMNNQQIEHILKEKFKAIEIPLSTIPQDDYRNDEEINEDYIYKLLTITDPDVIVKIRDEADVKAIGDEIGYKNKLSDISHLNYDLLIKEHNSGNRVSVVLEKPNSSNISNFKVYGFGQNLVNYLVARLGVPDMEVGDVYDRAYQFYLECLFKTGLIKF